MLCGDWVRPVDSGSLSPMSWSKRLRLRQRGVRKFMHANFGPERTLSRSDKGEELARAYLAQNVVPSAFIDDARHVAECSIARLDYLVSWNFKHLANVRRESGFNAVNILQGYPPVRIVPPTFLVDAYKEENL